MEVAGAGSEQIEQLYAIRLLAEPPVIAAIVDELSPANVAAMASALDDMERNGYLTQTFQDVHHKFHAVALARNPETIREMIESIYPKIIRHRRLHFSRPHVPAVDDRRDPRPHYVPYSGLGWARRKFLAVRNGVRRRLAPGHPGPGALTIPCVFLGEDAGVGFRFAPSGGRRRARQPPEPRVWRRPPVWTPAMNVFRNAVHDQIYTRFTGGTISSPMASRATRFVVSLRLQMERTPLR
jgi:hypothetical protein